jgi:hypothetical protein
VHRHSNVDALAFLEPNDAAGRRLHLRDGAQTLVERACHRLVAALEQPDVRFDVPRLRIAPEQRFAESALAFGPVGRGVELVERRDPVDPLIKGERFDYAVQCRVIGVRRSASSVFGGPSRCGLSRWAST